MRSVGLASFDQSYNRNRSKYVYRGSKSANVRHRRVLLALPPGNKLDEQVARLEDFFDASWEIEPPSEINTIDKAENVEEKVQSESDGSNQLVQLKRFKDSGVHQVNEYARKEAMKLKSIIGNLGDYPSKKGDVVTQEVRVPVEHHRAVENTETAGLAEKVRKDVAKFSSTTADIVSKNTSTVVSFGKQQAATVQSYAKEFSKQHPVLYDFAYFSVGLYASLWVTDKVLHAMKKVFKSKKDIAKQQSLRRKKGQRQRKRFESMLDSYDEGVDTSVFNAVRQIGATAAASEDYDEEEDEEEIVDRESMTKEMKAAWDNFVKESKLSEGEFWSQDNIDQGLAEIDITFEDDTSIDGEGESSIDLGGDASMDVDVDIDD